MLTLVLCASLQVSLVHDVPRFSAHLIENQAPEVQQDYSTWTREQLRAEYLRLDSERPSLGLPIALMVTGAVAFVVALYCALLGLVLSAANGSATTLLIIAAVAGLAGIGMLLSGVVLLIGALHDRRTMGAEMDRIRDQLDRGQTPAPPLDAPPTGPVPPPPGPTQVFAPVMPVIRLASF